ncbi:dihydroneopterin aldolase family protein [Candidatus Halobonum tyrrellensis]|uniref:Dihydroneopterin aldolase n=1 Tax=Candidatus Halobonum tyrrellensis G22 TaxID=1324957 RepID=V4J1L5_9EURY|nr:dihydroneopterin aldolase family protein [Candidatus Halobonum tyrrellensis]ESP89297.1 hypothetical protein K933_04746 [Candidatus Halobonum tyrrellensis G22]
MPTDAQQACFEAGIKFGSLYHQFAGTPVSPDSARSLERAMADAIENQPHCESVTVAVDDDAVREAIDHDEGYAELTGHLMTVEMRVRYRGVTVRTRMAMEDGYPRMRLVDVVDDGTSTDDDGAGDDGSAGAADGDR